jgi:CubicO group peptidase (beta-lactamase class C family)
MNTLSAAIQPFVDKKYIAGAVLLAATKDRILAHEAVGYADLEAGKPMTPDAMFWIASQTKPMTGTALMTLVDAGKVNVDEPVETYLPEFRGQKVIAYQDDEVTVLKKPRHPILVREVLNHTSGLAFSNPVETPTFDRLTLRESVRSHAMLPLHSEPGTKYAYSNAGTNTAGRIIEVIAGQAYAEFMDERFFHPLGMKDTTFWPDEEQLGRLAKVYEMNAEKTGLKESHLGQLAKPYSDRTRRAFPAGGLFSTAADCAAFLQMILSGGVAGGRRYVSEASIAQMTTKQTAEGVPNNYGFGWGTAEGKDGVYGHGGACKTSMKVDPALGLITVFLIQHNGDYPNEEAGQVSAVFTAAAEKLL